MMDTILTGVIVGVIMLIIGAAAGRVLVKSRTSESVEDINRELSATKRELYLHIEMAEQRNEMILESLLAILLTLKKGNANGEADEALRKLNEFMLKKSSKR